MLALFVLALAGPRNLTHSERATRPVLIDASASITPAMRDYFAGLMRDQLKLHDRDPVIMFASNTVDSTAGTASSTLGAPGGCGGCGPAATNLEAALNALAANPAAHQGPIVLLTDGWANRGNADAALRSLSAAGIQLYIFTPPGARDVPNIAMTQLTLPSVLQKAAPFSLGVSLMNLNATAAAGTISIYRDGTLIDERNVSLAPGQTRVDFPVRAESAGLASYRAVFKAQNPAQDTYPEDDTLEGWVGVGAQRKVLILTDSARDANYLDTAVRQLGMQATTVTLGGSDERVSPQGYDAVILNNVARSRLSPATQDALVHYVLTGGSLAMVGGDQSFGLGGYANTPLAKIMPVVMKLPEHHERKRALILVIDKSGSMGRNNKLEYAKAAALTVTKTMKDSDLIGVIGFDSQPFEVVSLQLLGRIRPYFSQLIDRLAAHGTTYLLPALEEANRALKQSGAAVKHVVILTDGETGGTATMYYDLVSSMHHEDGATISAIAIGREANLPLLEAIAKYGGGGFYQTDSPQNLPELFVEDVKQRTGGDTTMVEREFQPYSVAPDPVLKELAGRRTPPLKGFVSTELKPGAKLNMFVDSNGQRVPIIASWNSGAGKTLAITTDASGRWSGNWVRDGSFLPIWDKVLAWMTPPSAPAAQNFSVAIGYRTNRITLNLTNYSEGAASSSIPLNAIVTTPDGTRFETSLVPQALGEFSGSFAASQPGVYRIELKATHGSSSLSFPPLAYTVAPAITAEVPRPAPNYGLLEHLAATTGGRLNPAVSELSMSRPFSEQTRSLNPWLILMAMILLIAEALVRRLTF